MQSYLGRPMANDKKAAAHKAKMQVLKQEQARQLKQAADPGSGLVLVYTGDGKGKSSSAFGVIARALGWGHQVGVVQFIKGTWVTGESRFFGQFKEQLDWHTMGEGFTWDTQDAERDAKAAAAALDRAATMLASERYQLIVLDEINVALHYDYVQLKAVIAALQQRQQTTVILTGRNAKSELMQYADLVTEMQLIKHPFDVGIRAQQGVDF